MLPKSPSNDDKLVLILAEAFYKKHWIYACFEGEDFFFPAYYGLLSAVRPLRACSLPYNMKLE